MKKTYVTWSLRVVL